MGHRSREALIACEAAGYDVIIVETVGVGQSETTVADMTDLFLLLLLPGGGDELQGMKKGIVELADIVLVNKADGDMIKAANQAALDYQNAIHMLRSASDDWTVPARTCSALTGVGIDDAWGLVGEWRDAMQSNGAFERNRQVQAQVWMWDAVRDGLETEIKAEMERGDDIQRMAKSVVDGSLTVSEAAKEIILRVRSGKAT